METPQGQTVQVVPATPPAQGQPQQTPNTVDPNISQFVANAPDTPLAALPEQGQAQGQTQQASPESDSARELLRLANQRQAEIYSLQQQLSAERDRQMQFMQQMIPQSQSPDKATNPVEYLEWKIEMGQKALLQEAERRQNVQMQQMIASAAEIQWVNQHPGTDVQAIKMFNRANGIADWNLDAGHRLMNVNHDMAQVAQQTINRTYQQFQNNQNQGAIPIRGSQGATSGAVGLSYEKMAQAFVDTNGRIYNQWSPEIQKAFDTETSYRESTKG